MATQTGRFKVEWYGDKILKDLSLMTANEEKAAAQRIMKRLYKKVPVGKRRVRRWDKKRGRFRDVQYTRSPGRLRRSIRMAKSKFKDGGFLVFVGGHIPYYAYWVEKGTIFTYRQRYGRRGEQYMKRSVALEKARFIRQMRKRLGV